MILQLAFYLIIFIKLVKLDTSISCPNYEDIKDRDLNDEERAIIAKFTEKPTPKEEFVIENNDTFTDIWGYTLNWTNVREGWYKLRRYKYIDGNKLMKKHKTMLKTYTKLGYKVMDIPRYMYQTMLEMRDLKTMRVEDCGHTVNCKRLNEKAEVINIQNTFMYRFLDDSILNTMQTTLQPILEKWAKVRLDFSPVVYGIRRYTRGASLLLHVDKIPSHIISAIIQVNIQ